MQEQIWWEVFEATGSLEAFLIYQQGTDETVLSKLKNEKDDEGEQ